MPTKTKTEKACAAPENREAQDQIDSEIGEALAEMLELKVSKNGRVNTTAGTKTFTGLARAVRRVIEKTEQHMKAAAEVALQAQREGEKRNE